MRSDSYYRRFDALAAQHGMRRWPLDGRVNAYLLPAASPGDRLAILGSIHGDEPAGALALLRWLENNPKLVPDNVSLLVSPLFNPEGFDANTRQWDGVDLNRHFHPDRRGPWRNKRWMAMLNAFNPTLYLDLHECDHCPGLHTAYSYVHDDLEQKQRLTHFLGTKMRRHHGDPPGTSEEFVRRNIDGVESAVVETPVRWPLEQRIDEQLRIVKRLAWERDRLFTSS